MPVICGNMHPIHSEDGCLLFTIYGDRFTNEQPHATVAGSSRPGASVVKENEKAGKRT